MTSEDIKHQLIIITFHVFGSWPWVVLFQESGAWTPRRRCYSFTKLTPLPTGSCGSTSIAKLQLLPQLNPHSGGQSGPKTARSHLVVCVCTALSQKHTCPRTSAHRGAVCAHGKGGQGQGRLWPLKLWTAVVVETKCDLAQLHVVEPYLHVDQRWGLTAVSTTWYLHCHCHGTGRDLVQ